MAVRKKSTRFFEIFVEFTYTKNGVVETGTVYPPDYIDDEILEKVKKMCFPCVYRPANIECFSFVLTDLDASRRYGHVRLSEKNSDQQQALCIVSKLDWFDAFYRVLNVIGGIIVRKSKNDPNKFLSCAYSESSRILESPAGETYELVCTETDMCTFLVPPAYPTLKESRILSEYFSTIRPVTMVRVFALMLHERRMLFVSRRLSRLTSCIHAAASLVKPFVWQHLLIPVLPDSLIDYLQAPMPFIIGIHQELFEKSVRGRVDLGDCCLIMLDNNTIESEYDDLQELPSEVRSHFKRALQLDKAEMRGIGVTNSEKSEKHSDRAEMAVNCESLSKIFLRAMALCIGDYRDYFVMPPGEPVSFDEERFVASHRGDQTSNGKFYESLRCLQMFQQFIDDRLVRAVTEGAKPGYATSSLARKRPSDEDDLFETEARALHLRADDADRRYNAWLASSRDRLADLTVKMKSKSKEFRKRFRDERKAQLVAARGGSAGLTNPHATIVPSASLSVFSDEQPVERRKEAKPARPPPPVGYVPPTHAIAQIPDSTLKITAENNRSSDLVNWMPLQSGNLMEDPAIKELLTKQVNAIELEKSKLPKSTSLHQIPPAIPSQTPAQAPSRVSKIATNSENNLLLLELDDKPLSLLDEFDPLAASGQQSQVTLRDHALARTPNWRSNVANGSPTALAGTAPATNPARVSAVIQPGMVRNLASAFSYDSRSSANSRTQPHVSMFPTGPSMASWRPNTSSNYQNASAQQSIRVSSTAPTQPAGKPPSNDDDLIGF